MDRIQRWELGELEQIDIESEETKERFMIDSAEKLSWAFRKLKALKKEKTDIDGVAEAELYRIKKWHEAEAKKIDNSLAFFESLIMMYAMKKRTENPEFKMESTPYGKVRYVKQRDRWVYDDTVLVRWLFEEDKTEFIKTEHTPRKDEIKRRFEVRGTEVIDKETGEKVPGIRVEELGEKIEIKEE